MSQVGYDTVGSEWVDASTIGTLNSGDSYIIQNRGAGMLLALESANEPTADAGMELLPYSTLKYTASSDKLWLKATVGSCKVNICDA